MEYENQGEGCYTNQNPPPIKQTNFRVYLSITEFLKSYPAMEQRAHSGICPWGEYIFFLSRGGGLSTHWGLKNPEINRFHWSHEYTSEWRHVLK